METASVSAVDLSGALGFAATVTLLAMALAAQRGTRPHIPKDP